MKFKIDENLPLEVADLFAQAGHDVLTAKEQQLGGASDATIMGFCLKEGCCLVTLDLDFSDIQAYPPERSAGLIVIRTADQSKFHLITLAEQIVPMLDKEPIKGRLWIVEEGRIRIRGGNK